ncbi:MAG: TIGR01777 family oxidoreductase [Planctomycetota bacterium]|nr:TIGR01777 family oxidoreductase [Planctomycetota bacterium]
MQILMTGASGLVGTATRHQLLPNHEVRRLVRSTSSNRAVEDVVWDPQSGNMDRQCLEQADVVVHLAGENLGRRWNSALKQQIRDSRILGTQLLCETIAKCESPPRVLIAASAIGYYGHRGDEELIESSSPGSGFLAELVRDWEAATEPAKAGGTRVVNLRIGVVLSKDGGALKSMLLPFKLGLGGIVGNGRQFWSWIELSDLARVIEFAIQTESLSGPVNAVAPNPPTNREFTKALGRTLHRPTVFPMPAFAAKLVLGEMAQELLLASARVIPAKLTEHDFEYQHADLDEALRHALM